MSHANGEGWRTAQRSAQEKDRRDAERILDYLREKEGPHPVSALLEELAARGARISSWRLRGLLRYLVLRRSVEQLEQEREPGQRGPGPRRYRIAGGSS